MTPDGMDRLVELLDSAIDYIGLDQPELVPALAEARSVVETRAAAERVELAAELPGVGWETALLTPRDAPSGFARDADVALTVTPGGVRAALAQILEYHDGAGASREADDSQYERAKAFLRELPALPGELGEAVRGVVTPSDPSTVERSLERIARSIGWQSPAPSGRAVAVTGAERVAGLQEARDTALDRTIAATLRVAEVDAEGKVDPTAVADARSWAGVHEQAVKALVRVGGADLPRLAQAGAGPTLGPELQQALTSTDGHSGAVAPLPAPVDPWW